MEGSELPFEFVGEIAGASAVAEARNVKGGTASRHLEVRWWVLRLGVMGEAGKKEGWRKWFGKVKDESRSLVGCRLRSKYSQPTGQSFEAPAYPKEA